MYTLALILFLLICIVLTVSILLQSSKGGGMAGAFGGGPAMGAVFGGRGAATFLNRLTAWMAVLYLVVAFLISKAAGGSTGNDMANQSLVAQSREEMEKNPAFLLPSAELSVPAVSALTGDSTISARDTTKQ